MNNVSLVVKLFLAVQNTLQEAQTIERKKVDFVQNDCLAILHALPQRGRLKGRLTLVKDKIFHEVSGEHRSVAYHTSALALALTNSGLASSLRAVIELETLIHGLGRGNKAHIVQNHLKLFGRNLGANLVLIGAVDKLKIGRDIILRFGLANRQHTSQSIGKAEVRLKFKLLEEVHQTLNSGLNLFHRGRSRGSKVASGSSTLTKNLTPLAIGNLLIQPCFTLIFVNATSIVINLIKSGNTSRVNFSLAFAVNDRDKRATLTLNNFHIRCNLHFSFSFCFFDFLSFPLEQL